jgi:hypothetical protein
MPISHTDYPQFHIFYINQNNTVKQLIQTNTSDIWQDGPLSDLNLQAFDSPSTGLQACWKGDYYGDSDYTKYSNFSGEGNTSTFKGTRAMNIWYASDDSTFQQYTWYSGQDQDIWVPIEPWAGFNGHAGVGCYSWGTGSVQYAMLNNKHNDVEIWWKDTNANLTSTESHPINSWKNASMGTIDNVWPTTSLGYTSYFYAQMADKSIKGFEIDFEAENTTFDEGKAFFVRDPGGAVEALAGTHISVTSYEAMEGNRTIWDSLYVFFQTEGDDITAFTRLMKGGEWTRGTLPIPDE